jgi:glycine/D-amino acid oxidase-like deaminating enzyme/nitrite reductase/ring-hydroxylating ferredoxin subunit
MSTSLWIDRSALPALPPTPLPGRVDVAVVGAGLTGLLSALLLSRGGLRVAVVEARRVGAVTTGNTTAKLSLLQGTRLSTIRGKHSADVVRSYVEGNREGQQWLLRYCDEHGIACQRGPAFTYATSASGERSSRRELATAQDAGLDVSWQDDVGLPYETRGGVRLDDQAQFDPMDVLTALTTDVAAHGGQIHEQTRVRNVRRSGTSQVVETTRGDLTAGFVLLATGMPILDRGGFFARLEPQRSYAASFQTEQPLPRGMYLSADSPTRSVRTTPGGGGELLLTGGNGHVVGRHRSPQSLVDDLTEWTQRAFPGATRTHWWSAQDYEPVDELPYVGPLLPGNHKVLVATGYAKWGMTNAAAAALAISARVLGGQVEWADVLHSWRLRESRGAMGALKLNAAVGVRMLEGWSKTGLSRRADEPPDEGLGRVERRGTSPVATCTVDGTTHALSAVCPHLKGIVTWNDAEKSWDCPLHGSRFSANGDVLEGPAVTGLRRLTNGDHVAPS